MGSVSSRTALESERGDASDVDARGCLLLPLAKFEVESGDLDFGLCRHSPWDVMEEALEARACNASVECCAVTLCKESS